MSELIVLGLIPGTHIQITFALWAVGISILSAFCLLWAAHRTHIFRNACISLVLFALSRSAVVTALPTRA